MFNITLEKKDSLKDIQRKFESELSEKQIQATTARALNETGKTVQGFIKKQVRAEYTMSAKYLARMSTITHFASGNQSGLYTSINFRYKTIPMIAFKHTGKRGKKKSTITVQIKKGNSIALKHAFIAAMRNTSKQGEVSEHEGIYAAGRYVGKKFVYDKSRTASGKTRITEMRTASPFTMSLSQSIQPKIDEYVSRTLPSRLEFFLQRKLDKMKSK